MRRLAAFGFYDKGCATVRRYVDHPAAAAAAAAAGIEAFSVCVFTLAAAAAASEGGAGILLPGANGCVGGAEAQHPGGRLFTPPKLSLNSSVSPPTTNS